MICSGLLRGRYASTCNTIGQTAGYFESFVLMMALVEPGHVSFSAFAMVHGLMFILTTIAVLLFKSEAPVSRLDPVEDFKEVYMQMAQVQ